ncbi:hypothetical protein GOP47_0028157 [Adiantum capillus-veneris]|nr:hypothetical protein GOP47_0028157 [Adiantum capillus-veneris]
MLVLHETFVHPPNQTFILQDPDNVPKTAHLMALPHAKERLHLFKADLLEEGSFDAALDGCKAVFHTASPCFFTTDNPQSWYALSKIEAELEAWKLAKEHGLDLTALNTTSELVLKLTDESASTYANAAYGWVHMKDVAEAHILAYEVAEASGRYLCVESVVHYERMVEILCSLYPDLPIPTKCGDEVSPRDPGYNVCTDKVKGLGLVYTPIKDALKDCVRSLMERGLLKV